MKVADCQPPSGLQAERLMTSGALVPDAMILRLIVAELLGRSWISNASQQVYTVNASPSSQPIHTTEDSTPVTYDVNHEPGASYILDGDRKSVV